MDTHRTLGRVHSYCSCFASADVSFALLLSLKYTPVNLNQKEEEGADSPDYRQLNWPCAYLTVNTNTISNPLLYSLYITRIKRKHSEQVQKQHL